MKPDDFDYDKFLCEIDEVRRQAGPAEYVAVHSVEAAEAFAVWCIENGIEEPKIIVFQ